MNSFGTLLRLTTFGESHGKAMGGILDGMPSGIRIDFIRILEETARRRPGSRPDVSQRDECDEPEILSGLSPEGITLGTPIGFIVRNTDAKSADYGGYTGKFRPNHADFTYWTKYGIHDFRGGGRSSARETVSWVTAGAIVRQWLEESGISIHASFTETNNVMEASSRGDSTGGIVEGIIEGLQAGLGEPVFDKFHARLGMAMLSINAAKAFEYGDGTASAYAHGSESADRLLPEKNRTNGRPCASNHSGGVQGGITNGMPVNFKVYFKPTPTVMRRLPSIDTAGNECIIDPAGRHDPCVAIRAVPVVEAMAALVIGDMMRMQSR